MAFTADQVEELIEALHQDPALRDRVRNAILADDFLALPGLVARLTERVDRLTERVDSLAATVDELAVQVKGLVVQMKEQSDAMTVQADAIKVQADSITVQAETMRYWGGETANLKGLMYELQYRDRMASHLARHFRDVRPVTVGALSELHDGLSDGRLTDDEFDSVLRADAAAFARPKAAGQPAEVLVVMEISVVVDERDVSRVHERAKVLRKVGFDVRAAVDGQSILPAALALSEDLGVVAIVRKIAEPAA